MVMGQCGVGCFQCYVGFVVYGDVDGGCFYCWGVVDIVFDYCQWCVGIQCYYCVDFVCWQQIGVEFQFQFVGDGCCGVWVIFGKDYFLNV